ncbi:MAG: nif-specific transcriptional activator NifA [Spirochaetales bacterium]|nr:nif-specific transcriptional activator NifA [Spirochaetales bacterium]MCF7937985.1 nif-specific transcriptional activator NifA [Spirochaetales bacterium]
MTVEQSDAQRKINELSLLFEISQVLDQSLDLEEVMHPVFRAISEHLGMHRGVITLLDRKSGEIFIENAYGLSPGEQQRGKYRLGEGITGQVVKTGKPLVIPKVADNPDFLNRTGVLSESEKEDISFICVPVKIGNETIGTLSVDRLFAEEVSLDEDLRLLSIIASMIAQAVQLRQSLKEEQRRLEEENSRLKEELQDRFRPSNIIGNSAAMQEVYNQIAKVAAGSTTVLIRGESGTGKELVAHALHYASARAHEPFVKVNCSALPETVIESELFGHEKGAFTGAVNRRKGRFELAHRGTIFLDEIGDLSPMMQIKLLRVLQEREIERVGGVETIQVDVRVITATNRNLEELMASGRFREDLYYRLNVFPVHIPPLRDRKGDILLLADHFVEKYSKTNGKQVKRISTPAINLLTMYHWPGNVRELENCIERAVLLSSDDVIHGYHLPPSLQSAESSDTALEGTLEEALDKLERELIVEALKMSRGNMTAAARNLGITERIIGLRVKKYRIDPRNYRGGPSIDPSLDPQ